jgi:ubiquitin C-terminal hydrolase
MLKNNQQHLETKAEKLDETNKSKEKVKNLEQNVQKKNIGKIEDVNRLLSNKIQNPIQISDSETNKIDKFKSEKPQKSNECVNFDQYPFKKENKKTFLNDNIIVKTISFSLPRKEIIRTIKKVDGFYYLGNGDYDEEHELKYLSTIKPKGLKNIDGTCYMNSTLQCFYHIKELTDYFLKNKKKIKKKNGLISNGLLDVIEGLSQSKSESFVYSPKKFKANLISVDNNFKGSEGKDSADLALLILDKCHEELLDNYADLQDTSLDQRKESLIFLDAYLKDMEESSIIKDLFSFYVRIKNICFGCGTIFYSITLNNIIIFSLEQVFRANGFDITTKSDKRRVSIENCLSCFSFNGSFEKKEFKCQYCKKNSYLFSVKSFATLPKYLIMIMKRGQKEKFECHVDFEESIDLNDSYIKVEGAPKDNNTKYTLIGGTILYGSRGSGHTVAFCKHFDGQYYLFNDSNYRKISLNEIKEQKIYLLFYNKNV